MSYSLRLTQSNFDTETSQPAIDLTKIAQQWQRSTRHVGGYWSGSFVVYGNENYLADLFYNRLGGHVAERENGQITWEGYISRMQLEGTQGVLERDIETVANSVTALYTSHEPTQNIVNNSGFETPNTAGGRIFDSWDYLGTVAAVAGNGSPNGCQCTNGGFTTQTVSVAPNAYYLFSADYKRVSGGNSTITLYNAETYDVLLNVTVSDTAWTNSATAIFTPGNCNAILIQLKANGAGVAAFDNVTLDEITDVTHETTATNADSIARFGQHDARIEETANYYFVRSYLANNQLSAEAERDRLLENRMGANPRRIALGKREPKLIVEVKGYVFTLLWRIVPDLLNTTISAAIDEAVKNYGDFVQTRTIETFAATIQTEAENTPLQRWLLAQLSYDSGKGSAYRYAMRLNREFVFEAIDTSPIYTYKNGRLTDSAGAPVLPRAAQCGVWRDGDRPGGYTLTGARLPDLRDAYIEEIEIDENGNLKPRVADIPEGDILDATALLQ